MNDTQHARVDYTVCMKQPRTVTGATFIGGKPIDMSIDECGLHIDLVQLGGDIHRIIPIGEARRMAKWLHDATRA